MRFLIWLLVGILASCSDASLDGEGLTDVSLDRLTGATYENGREKQIVELTLRDSEKARLTAWLHSLAGSQPDFNTYAPVLTLEGQTLIINFLDDRTVIRFKRSTDHLEPWKQYSRSATDDDQRIKNWLKNTIPKTLP